MTVRLQNQKDPSQVLNLTHAAWFGLLDLASEYDWNPIGPVLPGQWAQIDLEFGLWDYEPGGLGGNGQGDSRGNGHGDSRLVVLEDALNLADALERAFLDYEPVRLPVSYFLFEPDDPAFNQRPSIGALTETIRLCQQGAFWIERYRRPGER